MKFGPKTIIAIILAAIMAIVLIVSWGFIFETNDMGYVQIKQAFYSGNMTCKTDPGTYGQWFGKIHTYPVARTFYFTHDKKTGKTEDQSLDTSFNDRTEAKVSGSVRILLPSNCVSLRSLHKEYKSPEGVMERLIRPTVRTAVLLTGPYMTASESIADRRAEFRSLIKDQLVNGIILVDKQEKTVKNAITGENEKRFIVTKRVCNRSDVKDEDLKKLCIGNVWREPSPLKKFRVTTDNFELADIRYPQNVRKQIESQRSAQMSVITQQTNAKLAKARAITSREEGKAQIEKTRAQQEVAKTKKIVQAEASKKEAELNAERKKNVAAFDVQTALLEKRADILRGEGKAAARKLKMQADGALTQKLAAWVKVNEAYAAAFSKARLVPEVVMGGSSGTGKNSTVDIVDLLKAKTARDIALEAGLRK